MHTKFWSVTLKGRDHSEDVRVDGDNIRMDLKETGWEDVDWIHLSQDEIQWRTVVNTHVVIFWVMTQCKAVVRHQLFGGSCCLHLQGEVKNHFTTSFTLP